VRDAALVGADAVVGALLNPIGDHHGIVLEHSHTFAGRGE